MEKEREKINLALKLPSSPPLSSSFSSVLHLPRTNPRNLSKNKPRVFPPQKELVLPQKHPKSVPLCVSRVCALKPTIMSSKWAKNPPKTNPERRDIASQRRDVAATPLFLDQLHKAITLSSELRFGCSWYRWKDLEV